MANLALASYADMSFRRAKAEAVITCLEKPISMHLLKLLCVGAPDVEHWRGELLNWLDEGLLATFDDHAADRSL
jgi:hypothetical protein